jgi:hypothetical protein
MRILFVGGIISLETAISGILRGVEGQGVSQVENEAGNILQ